MHMIAGLACCLHVSNFRLQLTEIIFEAASGETEVHDGAAKRNPHVGIADHAAIAWSECTKKLTAGLAHQKRKAKLTVRGPGTSTDSLRHA